MAGDLRGEHDKERERAGLRGHGQRRLLHGLAKKSGINLEAGRGRGRTAAESVWHFAAVVGSAGDVSALHTAVALDSLARAPDDGEGKRGAVLRVARLLQQLVRCLVVLPLAVCLVCTNHDAVTSPSVA